jgi:Mn2+/Fe2+ NRAMP family transporter
VVNGVIAVPIMAVMMWLGTRRELLGAYTLTLRHRVLGWFATAVMATAVVAMFVVR